METYFDELDDPGYEEDLNVVDKSLLPGAIVDEAARRVVADQLEEAARESWQDESLMEVVDRLRGKS